LGELNTLNRSQDETTMRSRLTLGYSFDIIFSILAACAVLGVLQTFVIGRHFLIPTVILIAAVLLGNVAWQGFQDRLWAKHVMFWCGFVFASHAFFALFWAQAYREVLGAAFLPVGIAVTGVAAYLLVQYARRNRLFRQERAQ
jgi:hypothetical protein